MADPYVPYTQFLGEDGKPSRAWLQWLLNPQIQTINLGTAVAVTSGGTGLATPPGLGQLLVGDGAGNYVLSAGLPPSSFPALTGDVTTLGGSLVTTIANTGVTPGSYGTGTQVGSFTVSSKGQLTAAGNTPITGAATMTVAGVFGCNGALAQSSAAVNSAVAGTAGAVYTATEQGIINALVALVNQLRSALVANGIVV